LIPVILGVMALEAAMMGRQSGDQASLFYEFRLEDRIPKRLRGLSGARDEFHLAAIVQNLKTLALRALGPPPERAVLA
jgi:hypothetical protein